MNEDALRQLIATAFRKKGRKSLKEKDFILAISMELKWYTPGEVKKFIAAAVRRKLLLPDKSGGYTMLFDPEKEGIGYAFQKPSLVPEGEDQKDFVADMVERISALRKSTVNEVHAGINRIRREKRLDPRVAALLAALQAGIDVSEEASALLKDVLEGNFFQTDQE